MRTSVGHLPGGWQIRVVIEDQGRVASRSRRPRRCQARRSGERCSRSCASFDSARNCPATQDQVLDALWPDLDPDVAINSLNQTIYFLRRVFEQDYSKTSPRATSATTRMSSGSTRSWSTVGRATCRASDSFLPAQPTPGRSRPAASTVSRAVRARLRVRRVGGAVSRLVARGLPRDRRTSRARRLPTGHFRPRHPRRPASARGRSDAEQIEVCSASPLQGDRGACGGCRAVRALRHVIRDELGIEPPAAGIAVGIGKVPY